MCTKWRRKRWLSHGLQRTVAHRTPPRKLRSAQPQATGNLSAACAAKGRLLPPNISVFAFTATPKAKTLELFGRSGPAGKPVPFHIYSMKQAIEGKFITDLERRCISCKHLAPWLSVENFHETLDLSAVVLTHYRLQDLGTRQLHLKDEPSVYTLPPICSPHSPEMSDKSHFLSACMLLLTESSGIPW